jgi:hypothetical protein
MLLKDFIREFLAVNIQLSNSDYDIRLDEKRMHYYIEKITISVRHKNEITTRHVFQSLDKVTEEIKNTTFISLQVIIDPNESILTKYKFVVTE